MLDLGKNLNDAFQYAQKLFSDLGRLLILVILSIIPILNFIVVGYAAKVASETPEGNAPPQLTGYASLFIEGLKVVVVGIVYMIIPLILIGPSIIGFMSIPMLPAAPGLFVGGLALIALFAGIILAILASILFYMGVMNMIKKNSFGKAFAFGEILEIIRNVGWGMYILWIIALIIIVAIVGLISAIPVVGWLISLIISPAVSVFIFRSAALVYSAGRSIPATEGTAAVPPPPAPPATQ
ncbi:MAG: DUF4013 domain-containing protein [Candidatus Methanosuratincola petrocarbonis]|nr:DUF4013 domain-containing protein [Candidatus Methanosuratincola sp.]